MVELYESMEKLICPYCESDCTDEFKDKYRLPMFEGVECQACGKEFVTNYRVYFQFGEVIKSEELYLDCN